MPTTEKRWFRMRGRYKNARDLKPITEDFLLTVTVTGSYHDMMQEASKKLLEEKGFFVTGLISHSAKKECL